MIAKIVNFRKGRQNQTPNQFSISSGKPEEARKLIGSRVVWASPAGKKIYGTITALHGNNGLLKVRFTKGLPGTALGKDVEIIEKAGRLTQSGDSRQSEAQAKSKA